MKVPQKIKNKFAIKSANSISGSILDRIDKVLKKHLSTHIHQCFIHNSQRAEAKEGEGERRKMGRWKERKRGEEGEWGREGGRGKGRKNGRDGEREERRGESEEGE